MKTFSWYWHCLFTATGLYKLVNFAMSESEALWISQNQAEIWDKTDKFLFLSGYLTYKMTGDFYDSKGSTVGYVPFDYKKHQWSHLLDWKWQIAPYNRSMFPELVSPGQALGQLTSQASKQMGLIEGLPVIASASDKACETLGCGVIRRDQACISLGTTATINQPSTKYLEGKGRMPAFPSAIPDQYLLEVMISRGFWLISWFKKQFSLNEIEQAKELDIDAELLLDKLLYESPPGSKGLMLHPYWSQGNSINGTEARGAILGFSDIHTRSYLYRAIIEGIGFGLREGKEAIESKSSRMIKEVRIAGGGSKSDNVVQIVADILGMPISRVQTHETTGLGAAINIATGLGYYDSYEKAVDNMVRVNQTVSPIPINSDLYSDLYSEVYLTIYGKLKPLYKKIQKITRYPE